MQEGVLRFVRLCVIALVLLSSDWSSLIAVPGDLIGHHLNHGSHHRNGRHAGRNRMQSPVPNGYPSARLHRFV